MGCPFTCIFCRQDRISGRKKSASPAQIGGRIKKYLGTIPSRNAHIEVAFFGGSFTGLAEDAQRRYLEAALPFLKEKKIHGIRLSTRPDFINQRILDNLKKYGVSRIELGVQSMSDRVLKTAERGHSAADVVKASGLILKNNVELGHQIMVGLPGSSLKDEVETAKKSVRLGASEVRIYPLLVIRGTRLADMWREGSFKPLTESEAVIRSAKIITLFKKHGVRIIRCGLHPSEGLLSGKDILAGPFHQAFGQKCETFIYRDMFGKFFGQIKNVKSPERIYYNPRDTAPVIGYKRSNALFIEHLLKKRNVLKPSSAVKPDTVKINFKNGKSLLLKP